MSKHNEQIAKSRLGRLLVNRGYISEEQLDEALKLQASEGLMLGEVLVQNGWISQKELNRTLKQQSRYRYTAAFVALVATPFQPMIAFAASPAAALPTNSISSSQLTQAQLGKFGGMQMLDDEEMAGVNAQGFGGPLPAGLGVSLGQNADAAVAGFQHKYQEDYEEYEEPQEEQIAYELADSVLTMAGVGPVAGLIDADISVEGVKYAEGRSPIEITEDGSMKFYMPTEIARISMENMRVKGNTDGPTMGSIYMSDIKYHPDSSYTISARN